MKYAIQPENRSQVLVWRYETLVEAIEAAKSICLKQNTTVEIFERIDVYYPVAISGMKEPKLPE